MNVEAIFFNQRHFGGERVVIHRHTTRDVALEFDRLCAVYFLDAQRAQPQGADDVGGMRDVVVRVFDGGADGFEIAPGLFQKQPVDLIGHGTQQRRDAALVVGDVEIGGGDDRRLVTPVFE